MLTIAMVSLGQPATEVYLFDLKVDGDQIEISNPLNISNNKGYDNQPSFLEDGCVLYVSSINGQTEVFHFEEGQSAQITVTPGGEYSPTPTPDGEHFSAILLEPDGRQLLWKYQINGENPKVLIPELTVGYHTWLSDNEIVSFVLGEPSTMQLSNLESGENKVLAENIGRSLHKIPGTELVSYIQNKEDGPNEIRSYNVREGTSTLLTHSLENSQDVAWLSNGTLLMGQDSKLYSWKQGTEGWKQISDLAEFNLSGITRLAVSPDSKKIAVVVSEN